MLSLAVIFVGSCLMLTAVAQPNPPRYTVVDLGPSGPAGQPFHISNNGFVAAAVGQPDGTDHAVIYFHGQTFDISSPGLGGANSMAFGINAGGHAVGTASTSTPDPMGEDFCGFAELGVSSAGTNCLPFVSYGGKMVALPTLDNNRGANGTANSINQSGEIAGTAENSSMESSCPTYDPSQGQFQRMQFKPVVWQGGLAVELPTVAGDPVGMAMYLNNSGEAVGATGSCTAFNFQILAPIHPAHAVLWEQDGTATDLQSLGGDAQAAAGNIAMGINNAGHVVGFSSLADDVTFHAFEWSKETGTMKDLGAASGITNSAAIAINDRGTSVGVSTDATHFAATVWDHGVATDLNTLVPADSSLYLLIGCSINSRGQIIGLAIGNDGQLHGYELDPAQ